VNGAKGQIIAFSANQSATRTKRAAAGAANAKSLDAKWSVFKRSGCRFA
jgi:hypothetical protein